MAGSAPAERPAVPAAAGRRRVRAAGAGRPGRPPDAIWTAGDLPAGVCRRGPGARARDHGSVARYGCDALRLPGRKGRERERRPVRSRAPDRAGGRRASPPVPRALARTPCLAGWTAAADCGVLAVSLIAVAVYAACAPVQTAFAGLLFAWVGLVLAALPAASAVATWRSPLPSFHAVSRRGREPRMDTRNSAMNKWPSPGARWRDTGEGSAHQRPRAARRDGTPCTRGPDREIGALHDRVRGTDSELRRARMAVTRGGVRWRRPRSGNRLPPSPRFHQFAEVSAARSSIV